MKEILQLLGNNTGIVIGEDHMSRAPLKLLIENAEEFQKRGVTHVFTEKFLWDSDFNTDYSDYMQSNKIIDVVMLNAGDAKKNFKSRIDFYNSPYCIKQFLEKMKSVGIVIVGINKKDENDINVNTAEGRSKWAKEMAEYCKKRTEIYAQNNKVGKSIILVGSAHAGTFIDYQGEKILGLDKRLNMPSLHICEVGLHDIPFAKPETLLEQVRYQLFNTIEECSNKKTLEGQCANYFVSIKVTDSPTPVPVFYFRQYQAPQLESSTHCQAAMYPASNNNNTQNPQTDETLKESKEEEMQNTFN